MSGRFWPRLCKNVFDLRRQTKTAQKLRPYANFRSTYQTVDARFHVVTLTAK